jgi:hypothetical protein
MNNIHDEQIYHFRLEGLLDPCWSEWLDGLTITHLHTGETLLSGPISDQATLHGLLAKIRDMNIKLISVNKA